jgi:hypothetical protein
MAEAKQAAIRRTQLRLAFATGPPPRGWVYAKMVEQPYKSVDNDVFD